MTTKQNVNQISAWLPVPPPTRLSISIFQFQQITKKFKMEQKLLRDLFCFQCSLQFNGKSVYDLHQSLVHGSKDLKMKKEIKSEKSDQESSNDAKSNTESPILPVDEEFKCNDCNGGFPSRSHLNRHVESVHREMKPFECNICTTSFLKKGGLKRHIESVHDGKKLSKCNICDQAFSQEGHLNKHIE